MTDKLAAADPGNRQYLRDIITASDGLAEWLRSQRRTDEAIAAFTAKASPPPRA